MASLKPGVLTKFLEDMSVDQKGSEDVRKPGLLQIRSIIPVLEEGDLWPNRGFYLKVSDLSHAMYVSLPHEHDEMIFSNRLQLGQFIYVQKLEAACPVPVLKGVMPVPGRHTCDGTPEDIIPVTNFVKFLETSNPDSIKDKGVISEKTINRGLSDPESVMDKSTDGGEKQKHGKLRSLDNDTDSDSPNSSVSSTRITKRRSWNEMELLDVKEIFDSSVAKNEIRPRPRSRSTCVSPVRSMRYDSSDENSTSTTRKRVVGSTTKLVKGANKSKITAPKIKCEETTYTEATCKATCSAANDRKGAESGISWDSLPSSLVKLGKEMIRHRDVALLAAVEALQEACAAEKLIKCLSTYSEFQSSKWDDPQPFIDKFFNLQNELAQARLILQSLTNITPLRSSETDMNNTGSVKEALNLAVERNKKATSWIKSAIARDLSPPCSSSLRRPTTTETVDDTANKSSSASRVSKPKTATAAAAACIVRKQRMSSEIGVGLTAERDTPTEWARGSGLGGGAELANALQDESRRSFVGYVEKFLDEVESKAACVDSDGRMAGMMYQMKRANDWLETVKGSCSLDDSEMEACGRVRNKIYELLLKQVERTAMALENMKVANQL